jgi:hypothetical protein
MEGQTTTFYGYNIGVLPPLGVFLGFGIGYTAPVSIPYFLYNVVLPEFK